MILGFHSCAEHTTARLECDGFVCILVYLLAAREIFIPDWMCGNGKNCPDEGSLVVPQGDGRYFCPQVNALLGAP